MVRNDVQAAATPRMVRTLMIMVVVGVATRLVLVPIAPGSLRYVARLVSNLAYVGGFGLMLARTPRWWMWLGAPFLIEAVFCAIDGQFSDLLMWSCCLSLVAAYHFRLRSRTLVAVFGVALVAVIALNGIKSDFRQTVRSEGLQSDERVALAARSWYTLFSSPGLVFSAQNLAFNVSRLNQGAITSRVLLWTPAAEPFARGETIWAAVRAALLPRILDPNKYVAGGFDNYPRFTGLQLNPGTSINISVPGEMYANFGRGGAYIGVFIYGVFLGLVFRTITRLARRSILWWAWAPFLLLSSIPAESGVGETLNQVSKSLVVMWAVMTTVPAWRVLRRASRPVGGGDVSRARPGMDLLVGGRI
jgi:hypothetical protein